MTVEEAKEELKEMWIEFDYTLHDKSANAIDVALKALEKQIPKKPIGDLGSVPHYRCPYCNRAVKLYKNDRGFDFCPDCGQKIDWSDDNDS